jgi:hypothetical protein
MKFKLFIFLVALSTCRAAMADPVTIVAYALSSIPELAAYSAVIQIGGAALSCAIGKADALRKDRSKP